ncbi:unnamed protein product [Mytilus coruscus]|uniref:Integrase zinc-binding domain-containing protein n=1 Tax=Mytilus coruscus TaxID=42192 RepID=A0A6J8AQK4_MYTCO|nr:unnamed protein product [Mytilus coruscus]
MGTGPKCIINIVNDTGLHVKIKKGSCLGYAEPVDEIIDNNSLVKDTYNINQVHLSLANSYDQEDKPSDMPLPAKRQVGPLEVKIAIVEENQTTKSEEFNSSIQGLKASSFSVADSNEHDMTEPNIEGDAIYTNWMQNYSPHHLRQLQLQDSDLFPLIEWIESQYDPSDAELRLQSPATRALWLLGSCLEVIDGVLYYKWINQSERKPCLVVPNGLKSDVLLHCHDSKMAGHLGQQKTLDRKKNKLWGVDLPLLTMALHSMVNRQTGYTPNRLMLGKRNNSANTITAWNCSLFRGKFDPDSWVAHLAKSLNEVHKLARENLRTTQHRQKRDYDLRLAQNQYHTGDLVYKIDSSTKIGHKRYHCGYARMRHNLFYDTSFVHAGESTGEDPLTDPDKTLYSGGQLLQNLDLVSDVSLNDEFQQLFIYQEDPDDEAPQGS